MFKVFGCRESVYVISIVILLQVWGTHSKNVPEGSVDSTISKDVGNDGEADKSDEEISNAKRFNHFELKNLIPPANPTEKPKCWDKCDKRKGEESIKDILLDQLKQLPNMRRHSAVEYTEGPIQLRWQADQKPTTGNSTASIEIRFVFNTVNYGSGNLTYYKTFDGEDN